MVRARQRTVLERHLSESLSWKQGYQEFSHFFGKPLGWVYILHEDGSQLVRIDRKSNSSFYGKVSEHPESCADFPEPNLDSFIENHEWIAKLPKLYKTAAGKRGAIFALNYLSRVKGFLILTGIKNASNDVKSLLMLFSHFLQSQVELAYRTFELQNFYETVHPRALALSTIHSVHRAMALSTGLEELLPRVGRLCSQVIKAKKCAVYLVDREKKYLLLKFALGEVQEKRQRIKIGQGIEGHVAETAEFHNSRSCVCVPFIEDDVVGVVALRDKIDGTRFTRTDLEILKTLSEQAVIAIKNAQLFEETERLTVSSIKTINELLELSFSGENVHLPLFGEISYRIGRDLGLSSEELTNLHRATYLIDAGHVGTPEHILQKAEKLTAGEYEQIKEHPARGAAILEQIGALRPVIPIILHHHERFDGKGYPGKLKGEEIPVGGRIVSVVDSFTAMISKRPYRRKHGIEDAVGEIKANSGAQFDPRVVKSFLKVIEDPEIIEKLRALEMRRNT